MSLSWNQIVEKTKAQYQLERILLDQDGHSKCQTSLLNKEYTTDKVDEINTKIIRELTQTRFYNSDVMLTVMCYVQGLLYMPPNDPIGKNKRVQEWFDNIKLISDKSVYGYATKSDFKRGNDLMIIKAPKRSMKGDEKYFSDLQHELFVGTFGTNNLRGIVPNYSYIYGGFRCSPPWIASLDGEKEVENWCSTDKNAVNYVIYENILPSVAMADYVETCTHEQFINLYLQILYALDAGVKNCDFTHYDLHAENVLIREVVGMRGNSFVIPYDTENGREYMKSERVATIIDFGLSHIQYKGQNYGVYDHIDYDTFPDKSFPMYDAYKLLGFSLYYMLVHENMHCFERCVKLLEFFKDLWNPEDGRSWNEVVIDELENYFTLQYNSRYGNMRVLEYTRYIRNVYPESNVSISQDRNYFSDLPLLGCDEGGCLNVEEINQVISEPDIVTIDIDNVQSYIFNFYDQISTFPKSQYTEFRDQAKILIDGFGRQYYDIINIFQDSLDRNYAEVNQEYNRLVELDNKMPNPINPVGNYLTESFLSEYQEYINRYIKLKSQIDNMKDQVRYARKIAEIFADPSLSNYLDDSRTILDEYDRNLRLLYEKISDDYNSIQEAIRQDKSYYDQLVKSKPEFAWYQEKFETFFSTV